MFFVFVIPISAIGQQKADEIAHCIEGKKVLHMFTHSCSKNSLGALEKMTQAGEFF